ncbi:MAG TPA: hypothetical protein VIA06_04125 [Candidatus Dormibacteraeota bacterium]|nr:hypothetical protein [Candidatus Dormibacteraeota bacterium]
MDSERERFLPLLIPDPASTMTADKYLSRSASGEYRPDWTWTARETADEAPPAVAVWWGDPMGSGRPRSTPCWCATRWILATGLLDAAHRAYAGPSRPPDHHIFLPSDHHDRPEVVAALAWRRERRGGLASPRRSSAFAMTGRHRPVSRIRRAACGSAPSPTTRPPSSCSAGS